MQQRNRPPLSYETTLAQTGREGEKRIREFLETRPNIERVEDVTEDRNFQRADVDFLVTRTDGDVVRVEVKHDKHMHTTQNFPFEVMRIHHESIDTPAYWGWTIFSKAQRFLVLTPDKEHDLIYDFVPIDVQRGMQAYIAQYGKWARIKMIETDQKRTTMLMLVPLTFIHHKVWLQQNQRWICKTKERAA